MREPFLASRSRICRIADLVMIFAIAAAGFAAAILSLVAQVSQ
jgi:hypothetical protein